VWLSAVVALNTATISITSIECGVSSCGGAPLVELQVWVDERGVGDDSDGAEGPLVGPAQTTRTTTPKHNKHRHQDTKNLMFLSLIGRLSP
jgi:hypothetical protein